ncbi:MAG: GTP cyclohydrolase I FolE [Balneola sp.]|nr:GTP cyclohydrolase I FolE [Balneola sp.]MBE80152.1 GTP cyclohydrolase I FolE [Balneola sp.]MBE80906.1 GTP cyclohydrolase I FolE [Balneola sp.]
MKTLDLDKITAEEIGEDHLSTGVQTPLRQDAFEKTDDEKIEIIQEHFAEIMHTLGLDLNDDSLKGTPYRVAKMYVKEIFEGLNPKNKPVARQFNNDYDYNGMVVEKNIQVTSFCEHHFLPFIGKAHVGYISSGKKVIGLSKINRIVDYYSRRPQVQERLTLQIADELSAALETDDIAVFIDSKHLCVSTRGIKDITSTTITSEYRGAFKEEATQQKFIDYIKTNTDI